jgi:hypothetical protein
MPYKIQFNTVADADLLIEALLELPAKRSLPAIEEIRRQMNEQLIAEKAAAEALPAPVEAPADVEPADPAT